MASLLAVPGLEKTSMPFRRKLLDISSRLSLNPDYLVTDMAFESGKTFSPSIQNPYTRATGLIQFMPSTAASYGTTVDALARLTAEQQLDYVERFFTPWAGRLHTLADHYLAVFLPSLVGKPLSAQVACKGSKLYDQNPGFDRSGSGCFTVADIVSAVTSIYNGALNKPRLPVSVPMSPWVQYVVLGAAVGATAAVGARLLKKAA